MTGPDNNKVNKSIKKISDKYPWLRSLKLRIFILFFLFGIIPAFILRAGILSTSKTKSINFRIGEAQTQLRILANNIFMGDFFNDPENEVINAELMQFSSFFSGRIIVIDDNLRIIRDTYGIGENKIIVSQEVVECLRGSDSMFSGYNEKDGYIEIVVPIHDTYAFGNDSDPNAKDPSDSKICGVLLASISDAPVNAALDDVSGSSNLIYHILLLFVLSAAVFASAVLVKPVDDFVTSIVDVKSGYTSNPVQGKRYLELERTADAFNQVLGRMRALDDSRQEFVSNVSHELKTPMTSMKVLSDSLLQQGEGVPEEMYREFLQDIDHELDRENKIISDLLTLTGMDRGQNVLNIKIVDVNVLLESVLKRIHPIAEQRGIEILLVSERSVTAEADEVKLNSVFTNLIENAVKYNKDNGKVLVTLDCDHKNMILKVEDSGCGIPEDSVMRVFERFYRVDKSRSREIGGTGLGLSITKSAVLLHKGTIEVESQEGVGSKFIVRIPLKYTPVKENKKDRTKRKKGKGTIGFPRIMSLLLIILLPAVLLTGCGSKDSGNQRVIPLYQLNREKTTICPEDVLFENDLSGEKLVAAVIAKLSMNPEKAQNCSPISSFEVTSMKLSDGMLTLDVSDGYLNMDKVERILSNAAIVYTLCQLDEVSTVLITVNGQIPPEIQENPVGMMSGQFISSAGKELGNYSRTMLQLYFANEEGDALIKTNRGVVYDTHIPLERLVIEEVLKGPDSDRIYPVLNPKTQIRSVSTRNGICYVDLDSSFLSEPYKVTPQTAVYALVNSLIELESVRKVSISVESDNTMSFMEAVSLQTVFERNLSIVEKREVNE